MAFNYAASEHDLVKAMGTHMLSRSYSVYRLIILGFAKQPVLNVQQQQQHCSIQ